VELVYLKLKVIGAIIGTPAEVSLIRMTTDGRLPENQRRNYKHCFDCLGKVIKEEGFFTMWRLFS
jgi:solute carrier family 25 oxoglutarate transporter 11